jgi:hypothetical protein
MAASSGRLQAEIYGLLHRNSDVNSILPIAKHAI